MLKFNQILQVDPSRTLTLRKKYVSALNRRFRALKGLINKSIITNDCFGLGVSNDFTINEELNPGQFAFNTNPEKVQGFMDWLGRQVDFGILEISKMQQIGIAVNAFWANTYIENAYKKGMQRARTELNSAGYAVPTSRNIISDFNLPIHADRVGLLYTRNYKGLRGITDEMDKQISEVLAQGMAEGRGPREIARNINAKIDSIGKHRATLLARTEIIRAHHHATIQEYENWGAVGVSVLAEWQTAEDSRVCEKCNALARKKTKFGEGVYTLKQALPMIPAHPQCVTGDSVIVSPDAHTFMKSDYSGTIFKFVLSNGTEITVTPNHMLLTPDGLVMARFLTNSDYLLYSSVSERKIFSDPNYNRDIARIDNIVKSFSESVGVSSRTMPVTPKDFHGDGIFFDKDVNIIRTTGFLKNGINSEFIKFFSGNNFSPGSMRDGLLGFGKFAPMLKRLLRPPYSRMCFSREFLAFFRGCVLHSQKHGITSVSGPDTIIIQNADYRRATNHEFFSKFFDRGSVIEEGNDFVLIDVGSIRRNIVSKWKSFFDKAFFNAITFFQTDFISQLCQRFSTHVTPVQILDFTTYHVDSLPVYDVSSMSTLYNINGVLSSNCRCVCLPLDITDNIELRRQLGES